VTGALVGDVGDSWRSLPLLAPPSVASRSASCAECGFRHLISRELPAAIRALPSTWAAALRSGGLGMIEEAARSRDELHAVANRVARILVAPGSTLSPVSVETPTEMARPPAVDLLVELLRMEADRLAAITDPIRAEWEWVGRVGRGIVTVRQLVEVPLHSTHRLLVGDQGQRTSVILLDAHRRKTASRVPSMHRRDRGIALDDHRSTGTGF